MFMLETVTPNKAMFIEKYCAIDSEKKLVLLVNREVTLLNK